MRPLILFGLALGVAALSTWRTEAFGGLLPSETMRLVIPSATAILLGFHVAYSCFFISLLEIRATRPVSEQEARSSIGQREAGARE